MELERIQIISIIINTVLFFVCIFGTGILIWKLNFKDRNSRLLFIFYICYWMSPLLCREYTGQMHLHMQEISDLGTLLFVPLIAYGLVGIFWRPLSDILSIRLKSRKKVLYLSLVIQVATIIPFIITQNYATNIIQSVGAGVGASCIGLFNLMFDDHYHHTKVFSTVSIVALPPILAELFSSIIEAICCSFLQEGVEGRYKTYSNVMIWLWYVALAFILISIILAIFIKNEKAATIYMTEKVKEPVRKAPDYWVVVLVCLAGACAMFMRWATAGPSSVTQLIFMGFHKEQDTRFIEAYLSCVFALGSLVGTALAGLWLTKSKNKNHTEKIYLIIIAGILWAIYLTITSAFTNIPVYFGMNFVNGLGLGLIWASMTGMMINKYFVQTKYLTPIGLFNTFLSIGICLATFANNWIKGRVFDFESFTKRKYDYNNFILANNRVNAICLGVVGLMIICMIIAYIIHIKCPPKLQKIRRYDVTGETEV